MAQSITLQNVADTAIVNNDILGQICFAAPNESSGTDSILVSASIFARSEGTFAADNNATELVFLTGATESAAPGATNYDMTLSSAGLLTITDDLVIKDGGTIGGSADADLLTLDDGALTVAGTLAATTGTFSGILKTDDATDATSTTDGSLQTDGGLSVAKDIVAGNDLILLSDSSAIYFGAVKADAIILTHVDESGLTLKRDEGGDNKPLLLTLATGETTLIADEVLSKIAFQAPDEASGTDSLLIAAAIQAVAEGAFNTSSNATRLEFMTGSSEAATTRMKLTSGGDLNITGELQAASIGYTDGDNAMTIADGGGVTFAANVVVGGTTPKVTIGDADAEDAMLAFDGNAQDFHIALDDTADDLVIGVGTTAGTTTAIAINEDAQVSIVDLFAANVAGTFGTFADGDATPSVATGNLWKHHASTQTINMFDDGVAGQTIHVISTAAITYDFDASNLKCGSADIVTASGDITSWFFDGTNWYLLQFMDVSADMSSVGGGGGSGMTSFQLEDGDGTEVAIEDAKEVKFIDGAGVNINWTDTSTGSDGDPYDLSFMLDLSDFSAVTPTNGDSLATLDSDGANEQMTTLAALATLYSGLGLSATNAVMRTDVDQSHVTSVGTISTGVWQGTDVGVAYGGTGASSHTAGAILLGAGTGAIGNTGVLGAGYIIVGDGTGAPTLLAPGDADQVLTSDGVGGVAWADPSGGMPGP